MKLLWKYYWVWASVLFSCLIGGCSLAAGLHQQYGFLSGSSTYDKPIEAAGGGLEIHDWLENTIGHSVMSALGPLAVCGLLLAGLIHLLLPFARQLLAGNRDNTSFDLLLQLSGIALWLIIFTIATGVWVNHFVHQSSAQQTFFR